ncbi:hypothetical protein PoB_002181100 [Plakobranchus ocellatus]|uniref:Uncharacterized protein n=1 Tax=Plakobranchus ocellatus TaxID=259542 RepID=A0AAV3ZL92_9GAST|nr:hypothetical protein PoB_002181100 [Plakobranchus ocellatus]
MNASAQYISTVSTIWAAANPTREVQHIPWCRDSLEIDVLVGAAIFKFKTEQRLTSHQTHNTAAQKLKTQGSEIDEHKRKVDGPTANIFASDMCLVRTCH